MSWLLINKSMKKFKEWLEARQTMIMPAAARPDVMDVVRQAEEWAAQKKAEGWKREDFAKAFQQILMIDPGHNEQ